MTNRILDRREIIRRRGFVMSIMANEKARSVARLVMQGWTDEAVAHQLGYTSSWAARYRRLANELGYLRAPSE